MSSFFGNLNSSQGRPLFSTPGTNATSQPGLFSGLNPQPATSTSGLFGSLGSTLQPQQQAGTGSFGSLGASSQPQQQQPTSSFGGLGASSQAQQAGGGLFGTASQLPHQHPSLSSAGLQNQAQQSQPNGEKSTYFDTILDKTRKRALGETADEDIPQLQLGLGDLRQKIKKLAASTADGATDLTAPYLLAASGVDTRAAVNDLKHLSTSVGKTERPRTREAIDTDVEAYLASLQTQTTLSMISDGLARSIEDFDTFLDDNVTMEWDVQRKKIYQHFGIRPKEIAPSGGRSGFAPSSSDSIGAFGRSRRSKAAGLASSQAAGIPGKSTFGRSGLQRSVIGAAGPIGSEHKPLFADVEKRIEANGITTQNPSDRAFRERQSRLAEKVQNLNVAREQERCYPLLHEFASVAAQGGEKHATEIAHAYRALIEIVGESLEAESDPHAVKERQFANKYLDEVPNSDNSIDIRKRILVGSARFLEKLFFEELETTVAKSPREANLGGIPNVLSKVKAYVRLRASRKDLVPETGGLQMLDEDYVWALIYYLLRSGHVKEAVDYVRANTTAFRAIDRQFATYITNYLQSDERRLSPQIQVRINNEYNQRLRLAPKDSIDPFRMACYKIIGRCDLQSRLFDGLQYSWYDHLWLQFVLAREVRPVDEIASEVCNLATVHTVIKDIGEKHLKKSDSYGVYFLVQVLGGLFEEAVEYLYPHAYPDAVHFAIALDFYGLLRVSDPDAAGESLLSFTTRGIPQLNFGRMVGLYTRDFRTANISAAVDYLTLICLNKSLSGELGRKQVLLCHDALRELVLESREFALLLGDINTNGQRIKGIIQERLGLIALEETDDFMKAITIQAASIADDNGRITDAVLLYHLAEEFDNVVVIINRALSESISAQLGQDQIRLQPLKPRINNDNTQGQGVSLSLTSVDDPVTLAKIIIKLYSSNQMYGNRIKQTNGETCNILLTISEAKILVEHGRWTEALDVSLLSQICQIKAYD